MAKVHNVDKNMEASKTIYGNIHINFIYLVLKYVMWYPIIWLPKYGEDVEAIEGLFLTIHKKTLTTMSMECYVLNDHIRCWGVIFGTIFHSSWAVFDDMIAITNGEGGKIDIVIHGTNTLQDVKVVVHMREVTLVDSLGIVFYIYTWKGRPTDLRTILQFLETILADILTVVWRVEILDNFSIY